MAYINPEPKLDEDKSQISNTSDVIEYNKINPVYFAFIDVLGFQNTYDKMHLSKNEESIKKYSNVFKYYFSLMNSAKFIKDDCCYAGQTSDSLYFYTDRLDYLFEFIKIFAHFNLYAMSQNVFFRGGIAKGELYIKEKYQYFGDSVIKAYLLESQISKYPIMLLDENTYNDIKSYNENEYLIDNSNKRHLIKPFAYLNKDIKLDLCDETILKKINSKDIISNINENKQLFEYDEKNFNKYVFLLTQLEEKDKINKGE